jgi:hypothetical protein
VRAMSAFRVDRVAPTLTLVFPPNGVRSAWQRDELIAMLVRPSEPLNASSVVVTLSTVSAPSSLPVQTVDLSGTSCSNRGLTPLTNDVCVLLDLASPVMNAVSESFTASATANDLAGNPGSTRTSFPVTRVKWFTNSLGMGHFSAAPALDSAGNIYVGSETLGNDGIGSLHSYNPAGQARSGFPLAIGGVRSLSVSRSNTANGTTEVVYAAVNLGLNAGAELRAFTTSGQTTGLSTVTCRDTQRPTHSALALFDGGVGEARAALVFSGAIAGTLCEYGPATGASTTLSPARTEYVQASPGSLGAPFSATNLVIRQNRVWFQSSSTNSIVWADLAAAGPAVGGSNGTIALATPTGLSLAGNVLLATWDRATGGVLSVLDLPSPGSYEFAPSGNGVTWGTRAFAPAIMRQGTSGTQAFALTPNDSPLLATTNGLFTTPINLTTRVLSSPSTALAQPQPLSDVVTTPVIGTGAKVYAVTRAGSVFVYQAEGSSGLGGASPLWNTNAASAFGVALTVLAPPTLDCNRGAPNRPGTLYVLGQTTGGVGVLGALIVDSTKLEPSAPWPKWQRTAGNSGNPDFPLNPGCP